MIMQRSAAFGSTFVTWRCADALTSVFSRESSEISLRSLRSPFRRQMEAKPVADRMEALPFGWLSSNHPAQPAAESGVRVSSRLPFSTCTLSSSLGGVSRPADGMFCTLLRGSWTALTMPATLKRFCHSQNHFRSFTSIVHLTAEGLEHTAQLEEFAMLIGNHALAAAAFALLPKRTRAKRATVARPPAAIGMHGVLLSPW